MICWHSEETCYLKKTWPLRISSLCSKGISPQTTSYSRIPRDQRLPTCHGSGSTLENTLGSQQVCVDGVLEQRPWPEIDELELATIEVGKDVLALGVAVKHPAVMAGPHRLQHLPEEAAGQLLLQAPPPPPRLPLQAPPPTPPPPFLW